MKTIKIFQWIPRIISILAILFVSGFAFDSFDSSRTIWEQIGGFLIHLTPTYVLVYFLIFAWKRELIGGIIFMMIGIGLMPFIYMMNYHMNHSVWISLSVILLINFPFVVTGALFMISHYLKKKNLPEQGEISPPEDPAVNG